MTFSYNPRGVCSRRFDFDIEGDVIKSLKVTGGCMGNLSGISKLVVGMNVNDVINKLEGTDCNGRGTSCPDQISKALKAYLESK